MIVIISGIGWGHESVAQKTVCPDEYYSTQSAGLRAVELAAGPKPFRGWVGSAGLIHYFNRIKKPFETRFPTFYLKGNVDYAADQLYGIKHHAYAAEVKAGVIPLHTFKKIFPSLNVGGVVSYDKPVAENAAPGIASQLTGFKTGFSVGGEVLLFFSLPQLCLAVNYSQLFLNGENWGDARVYSGVGLRWHFSDMKYFLSEKKRESSKSTVPKRRRNHR